MHNLQPVGMELDIRMINYIMRITLKIISMRNPYIQRSPLVQTILLPRTALEIGIRVEDAEATWHKHDASTQVSEVSADFQTLNRNPNGHVLDGLAILRGRADTQIMQKKRAAAGSTNDAGQK